MKAVTGAVRTASGYRARPAEHRGEPVQGDALLSFVGRQATVGKSGMTFPQNLPERSWEQIGTNLRELVNSSAWWLGDWLIYGEATYGWRRYKEAVERTGLDYQTLRNYAWVARRFEHDRRRDGLSFAHHAEVTRLSPPEQDYWLRKAEQHKWSRNELRRALRAGLAVQSDAAGSPATGGAERPEASRPTEPATGSTVLQDRQEGQGAAGGATLTIELSAGQLEHCSKAAAAHGLSLTQWAARVLEAADRPAVLRPGA
ncbi:LmbU family transcriptional regulator [Streptomyces sp. NPDC054842]